MLLAVLEVLRNPRANNDAPMGLLHLPVSCSLSSAAVIPPEFFLENSMQNAAAKYKFTLPWEGGTPLFRWVYEYYCLA